MLVYWWKIPVHISYWCRHRLTCLTNDGILMEDTCTYILFMSTSVNMSYWWWYMYGRYMYIFLIDADVGFHFLLILVYWWKIHVHISHRCWRGFTFLTDLGILMDDTFWYVLSMLVWVNMSYWSWYMDGRYMLIFLIGADMCFHILLILVYWWKIHVSSVNIPASVRHVNRCRHQ